MWVLFLLIGSGLLYKNRLFTSFTEILTCLVVGLLTGMFYLNMLELCDRNRLSQQLYSTVSSIYSARLITLRSVLEGSVLSLPSIIIEQVLSVDMN
jgi:hypothetical protein